MVTGLTANTFKRLQLNAGVFLTDFDYSTIHTASALRTALQTERTTGTHMLGATRGGGTFACTPEMRNIEADGKRYEFVGSTVIDAWNISMSGTLLEITSGNLQKVLAAASVTKPESGKGDTKIEIRTDLADADYISHLIWVGDMSDGLMLIDLENALNTNGATLTFTDKGEGTLPFEFKAHQASVENSEKAPVKIYLFEDVTE